MKFIKNTERENIQQLTKKDVVAPWGSCNAVARNNSVEGMKHILDFERNSNHTNVILMSVPHRHDVIRNSCVNNVVEAFDRRLWNRMERFENAQMINAVFERDFYMTRGQRLNTRGK